MTYDGEMFFLDVEELTVLKKCTHIYCEIMFHLKAQNIGKNYLYHARKL